MMSIAVDLDGTLLTCEERHRRLMDYWARACGQALDSGAYWTLKRQGASNIEALANIGIRREVAGAMCAGWLKDIEHWPWLGFDRVSDGVIDTLKTLRKHGVEIHVLTARREPVFLQQQLQRTGLDQWIDGLLVVPPDQAISAKAECLRRLRPSAWIGDTESDALAALEAHYLFWPLQCGMRAPHFWKKWLATQPGVSGWKLSTDLQNAIRMIPTFQHISTDIRPTTEFGR